MESAHAFLTLFRFYDDRDELTDMFHIHEAVLQILNYVKVVVNFSLFYGVWFFFLSLLSFIVVHYARDCSVWILICLIVCDSSFFLFFLHCGALCTWLFMYMYLLNNLLSRNFLHVNNSTFQFPQYIGHNIVCEQVYTTAYNWLCIRL